MKKNFKENLINKIKKEKVKQVPKCIFIIKRIFIWSFLILSVFLGALSLSISFEYILNADWLLINRLGLIKIVTIFLPFFWILFLIFATLLSYYNFRHTQKGYKFSFLQIAGINFISSLLLGIVLYFSGANAFTEGYLEKLTPRYRANFVEDRDTRILKVWHNVEKGLLIGEIVSRKNPQQFSLKDPRNILWEIHTSSNTQMKHPIDLVQGVRIKLIGKEIGERIFEAHEIRHLRGIKQQGKKIH